MRYAFPTEVHVCPAVNGRTRFLDRRSVTGVFCFNYWGSLLPRRLGRRGSSWSVIQSGVGEWPGREDGWWNGSGDGFVSWWRVWWCLVCRGSHRGAVMYAVAFEQHRIRLAALASSGQAYALFVTPQVPQPFVLSSWTRPLCSLVRSRGDHDAARARGDRGSVLGGQPGRGEPNWTGEPTVGGGEGHQRSSAGRLPGVTCFARCGAIAYAAVGHHSASRNGLEWPHEALPAVGGDPGRHFRACSVCEAGVRHTYRRRQS